MLTVKEGMNSIELLYGDANKKADVVDAAELIAFNTIHGLIMPDGSGMQLI